MVSYLLTLFAGFVTLSSRFTCNTSWWSGLESGEAMCIKFRAISEAILSKGGWPDPALPYPPIILQV